MCVRVCACACLCNCLSVHKIILPVRLADFHESCYVCSYDAFSRFSRKIAKDRSEQKRSVQINIHCVDICVVHEAMSVFESELY